MLKRKVPRPRAGASRRPAEPPLRDRRQAAAGVADDRRLVHELEVHRHELELQNEELRDARERAEEVASRFTELFQHSPIGYATVDAAGVIELANLAVARLLGEHPARLTGRRFGVFVAPRDRAAFHEFLTQARTQPRERHAQLEVELSTDAQARDHETPAIARLTARRMPTATEILLSVEDVTERRRADEQLREADRRKAEFLVTLSHELRTPLAAILTAAHILEHRPGGDSANRARAIVRRQAEHLARLVDDLLDVSRIERGKLVLKRARTDLRDVVLRVADDFRTIFDDRGVTFRVAVPASGLFADADGTRVTQIVGNLLHNASKFTRSGDEVTLSLSARSRHAEIRVKDSGAGIDPAVLPHIFGAFVQSERTAARSAGGLGVGLAVVKALTELHGGAVRAESAGVGQGAEFVIRLPAEVPASPRAYEPAPAPARAPEPEPPPPG